MSYYLSQLEGKERRQECDRNDEAMRTFTRCETRKEELPQEQGLGALLLDLLIAVLCGLIGAMVLGYPR